MQHNSSKNAKTIKLNLLSEGPPPGDALRDGERDGDPMLPDLDTSDDLSSFTFPALLSLAYSTKLSYKELLLTPRPFTLPLLISSFTSS